MIFVNPVFLDAANTKILVTVDGVETSLDVDTGNRVYAEMLKQSVSIGAYSAGEMGMDELRLYRNKELDRVDREIIAPDLWEAFDSTQKSDFTTYKQALRDLPASIDLTDVDAGDRAAAEAKFPTFPT